MRLLLRLQHRSKSQMHCTRLRYFRATELNNEVVFICSLLTLLLLLLLTIRCSKDCMCVYVLYTYCVYRPNRVFLLNYKLRMLAAFYKIFKKKALRNIDCIVSFLRQCQHDDLRLLLSDNQSVAIHDSQLCDVVPFSSMKIVC